MWFFNLINDLAEFLFEPQAFEKKPGGLMPPGQRHQAHEDYFVDQPVIKLFF
jgi:hypothetical protein